MRGKRKRRKPVHLLDDETFFHQLVSASLMSQ